MVTNEGKISIISGMKSRSISEERAYDNPGHMQEYVFKQKLANFHWELIEMAMEAEKDPMGPYGTLVVLAPREHAKTTLYAEGIPLWKIGKNPTNFMGQIISSTSLNAAKRVKKIGSCIQFNERYIQLFGNLYPGNEREFTWSDHAFEVLVDKREVWEAGVEERDPTMAAYGITTSVEGARATDQCFDDIVSKENSNTKLGRDTLSEKFWMSFEPMLLPMGVKRIIGTRYYPEDFYAELLPKFDSERRYTALYIPVDESKGIIEL